ncbi:hypothetical protein SAY86_008990 [Trapa natans]|uniref:Uncharacterized protein n=1 Tax=Trapa natans TaxID=22666 RepID=A0AAN7KGH2_TRANT|nr:hypothetical protein SAY86_008990 [Trapa natans]
MPWNLICLFNLGIHSSLSFQKKNGEFFNENHIVHRGSSPLVNESKGRINTSSSCPTVGVSSYQVHPNGDAASQTKDVMNLTFIHMPPQRSCPFSTRLDFFEGSSSTVKSSICGPLSH